MSTITKTNFGQINFKSIVASVGFYAWGVGNVPQNVTSRMENDENLQEMIRSTCSTYAQRLKMAWDVKN
jgi:hypothetical protein